LAKRTVCRSIIFSIRTIQVWRWEILTEGIALGGDETERRGQLGGNIGFVRRRMRPIDERVGEFDG
jgi:hypothetical protein